MVSIGIDVSKGKSTVCLMRAFGEIVAGPMEITHVDSELKTLVKLMKSLNDEVKVVMEATGVYHYGSHRCIPFAGADISER